MMQANLLNSGQIAHRICQQPNFTAVQRLFPLRWHLPLTKNNSDSNRKERSYA